MNKLELMMDKELRLAEEHRRYCRELEKKTERKIRRTEIIALSLSFTAIVITVVGTLAIAWYFG